MKIRVLLAALSSLALTTAAWSQSTPAPDGAFVIASEPRTEHQLEPKQQGPTLLEEQGYVWIPHFFIQRDEEGRDTNRRNLYMPSIVGENTEMRGVGQLFAPGLYANWFDNLADDTTNLAPWISDAYFEQFRDARDFTIDTIVAFFYKNWLGPTQSAPVMFYVFGQPAGRTIAEFNQSMYKQRGINYGRSSLPVMFETEISIEGLDTTISENNINPTLFAFDPPLAFTANTAALAMFINDDGEVIDPQPGTIPNDTREWQTIASFYNRREGRFTGFPSWMAQGLLMFRNTQLFADSIRMVWASLLYRNGDSAVFDNWINFSGVVDLGPSGVKYHFGREATSQGLGTPTPNPITADSRLPFSLTEVSDVTIDLYDVRGMHVREILRERYVPGNYTVPLKAGDLANGNYVVRMVAGGKAYSMKFNVGR